MPTEADILTPYRVQYGWLQTQLQQRSECNQICSVRAAELSVKVLDILLEVLYTCSSCKKLLVTRYDVTVAVKCRMLACAIRKNLLGTLASDGGLHRTHVSHKPCKRKSEASPTGEVLLKLQSSTPKSSPANLRYA